MTATESTYTAPTPRGIPDSVRRLPFWLVIGFEKPGPATRCPVGDCTHDMTSPTDLYCRVHSRFLPYSSESPSKTRKYVVNILRAAVLGAFSLTAQTDSPVPLAVLGAVTGLLLVILPLRLYFTTAKSATLLWVGACLIRLLMLLRSTTLHQIVGTTLVCVFMIAVTWYLGELAARYGRPDSTFRPGMASHRAHHPRKRTQLALSTPGRSAGTVAAVSAITPGAFLLWLAIAEAPGLWIEQLPHGLRTWLLWTAVGGPLGSLFAATVAGFLDGSPTVDTRVDPKIPLPLRPRPVDPRQPSPPSAGAAGGIGGPLAAALRQLAYQLQLASVRTAATAANLVRLASHLAASTAVRCANWTHRQVVIMARRVRATLHCAAKILRDGALIWWAAAYDTGRVLVLPVVCVATAVAILGPTADRLRWYLTIGRAADLGLGVAGIVGLSALTTVAWMTLCGGPADRTRHSAWHNTQLTMVQALVLTGIGGIVVGLPGTLGHGAIHIGLLTITLDVLFALLFAHLQWREHRRPAPPDPWPAEPRDEVPDGPSEPGAHRG